ncbi:hypothetical protein [Bordetella avium]|uniref:hypothetical protein n=1 Tax=Bordetella avium TaxID=521 RepID=UPI0011C3933B|nr:hypothetical protein [Bordetella avium]
MVGIIGLGVAGAGLSLWTGYESPPKPGQTAAPKKPKSAAEMAKDATIGKIVTLVGVALVVGAFGWYKLYHQSEGQIQARLAAEGAKACEDETMAYVMSQGFVKRQLKAPSSASFPNITEVISKSAGGCKFKVTAYVDAQNGFGAKVRTYYSADMEYLPNSKTWGALDVKLDQ